MKRPLKIVPFFVLLCLLGPAAHAQEASGVRPPQAKPAESGEAAEPEAGAPDDCERDKNVQCVSEKLKSLRLGWAGRIARGFQYQYQLNEQTGSIIIGNPAEIVRNPEDYLQQHTFTFKFGELFADRLSQFKRGSDYLKRYPQAADEQPADILCKGRPLITCLTKGGRWWQRALMGTSVNVTLSERAAVKDGFIVTDPMFGHDYQVNGGFAFDPAKLFPTATNWKGAFDEVQKVDKALALLGASDAYGGQRPWEKNLWVAAVIPKVEFKVLSQFDYLKFEGALQRAPFHERALNTFTFTWDLTRAIPDTKSRIDADLIAEALGDLQNNLGLEEPPAPQKRCSLHLPQGARPVDVHPSFSAESCRKLAEHFQAESYELSCVLKGGPAGRDAHDKGPKTARSDPPARPPGNLCKW